MPRIVPAIVLLAAAPLSLSAQAPLPGSNPCLSYAPENTIEWPLDGPPSTGVHFGRVVTIDLDGDQAPEGVVNEDGEVFVLWKVAVYDAVQAIAFPTQPPPTSVKDVAALPGGGVNGANAVLMTDGRGLYIVSHHGGGAFYDPTIIPGNQWKNAAPIHVDDVDQNGYLDVIGISSDQRYLLICKGSPSGFGATTSVLQSNNTRDVVAVDLDMDGARELVTLGPRGLRFHTHAGTVLSTLFYLSPTGCIARFAVGDDECLAWTRQSTVPGTSELLVLGDALDPLPNYLSLAFTFSSCSIGAIHPVAMLSGDYNGDALGDLLLVHGANENAVVLVQQEDDPFTPERETFATGPMAYDLIPLPASPAQVGIPAFAQLDAEDIVMEELVNPEDFVFPVASGVPRIEVFSSLPSFRSWVSTQVLDSADIVLRNTEFGPTASVDTDPGKLRLAFTVPLRYRDYTYLDLILWEQLDGDPMPAVVDQAIYRRRHDFLLAPNGTVSPFEQWIDVEYDFQPGICWDAPYPVVYTEFRFVKVLSPTSVTRSKVFTGGFRLEHCQVALTDFDYLTEMIIPNVTPYWLYEVNGLTGEPAPPPVPKEVVGIYVPMSSQPPFQDGILPDPGERGVGGVAHIFYQFD
jgi:hypothetical protein